MADIGAQQLGNDVLRSHRIMPTFARLFGVALQDFGKTDQKDKELPAGAPPASRFWDWLSCPYLAIDIDGSPQSLPLDLNFDEVPRKHRGRYQLVMNCGTTEHVGNQNQAMKVIHDLTAVGGVMIHTVPMQGFSNHGLINYTPKFFWMLSRGCRYRWLDMRITYEAPSPLSPDIIGEIARFSLVGAERLKDYRVGDAGFTAVLQKTDAKSFVPPIDLATAALEGNQGLRARYG